MVKTRNLSEGIRKLKLFVYLNVDGNDEYEFRTHPSFPTACWRWDNKEKKHKILIGLGNELGEKFEKDIEYFEYFGYHEISHSLYTTRDIKSLNGKLKKEGIPFPLFNLFEDARIEHLFREKFGRPFRWKKWEEKEMDDKLVKWLSFYIDHPNQIREWKETGVLSGISIQADPTQMFLLIVQTEGEAPLVREARYSDEHLAYIKTELGNLKVPNLLKNEAGYYEKKLTLQEKVKLINELIARIHNYYQRATQVNSSEEMIELLKEWCEEFPQAKVGTGDWIPQLIPSGPTEAGYEVAELTFSDPDNMTEEEFNQLWDEAKNGSDDEDEEGLPGPGGFGERGDKEYSGCAGHPIIETSRFREALDWNKVRIDVERLLKAFRLRSQKSTTTTPSKKLSTRKLMMERDDVYIREQEVSIRVRPFTVLVDCSGSMSSMTPNQHYLVAVFSELARKTRTQAYLILTKNLSQELFKLPVSTEVVENIPYDGGSENLLGGLLEFERYILKTDYIFVVSDMQITDYWTRTEEKIKELQRKGKEVIGIYKGERYKVAHSNAQKFFSKYVITQTSSPIDLLIPLLKRVVVLD